MLGENLFAKSARMYATYVNGHLIAYIRSAEEEIERERVASILSHRENSQLLISLAFEGIRPFAYLCVCMHERERQMYRDMLSMCMIRIALYTRAYLSSFSYCRDICIIFIHGTHIYQCSKLHGE